ncbi:Desumoylating isopeptidase 1 homolog (DeSI-1) (Polyubiquitinated substrate transporter) (POST) [Durusdinium trenchii]|uniref:Desumoylating isopeptidase 1 homolog (DeSI-1) (Polyubiquitinated substrate transporter) (POST) n=1 Tax=Durusdinium trenchii TaxID=1381693 RepID=A0ABP0LBV2_9DINO
MSPEAATRLSGTLLESALCALNVALDMFVSCVLSCISLPLATGSLLISGFGRLGFLEKSWEKAKAPRIQARQDTSDDSSPLELNIEDAQPEGLVGKSSSSGSSNAALLGRSSYPDHEYTELGCRGSRGGVVKLNIYDVSHESSIQNLNVFLAHPMSPFKFGGVFHAGVEIGGKEWSFGYAPVGSGVHCSSPRQHPQHNFRETLVLGTTTLSRTEVAKLLESMVDEYPGNSYHLIRCNCNHFASDLCRRLGVGDLPAWVERLAWIGESLLEASEGLERFRCVVEDATAVASH